MIYQIRLLIHFSDDERLRSENSPLSRKPLETLSLVLLLLQIPLYSPSLFALGKPFLLNFHFLIAQLRSHPEKALFVSLVGFRELSL